MVVFIRQTKTSIFSLEAMKEEARRSEGSCWSGKKRKKMKRERNGWQRGRMWGLYHKIMNIMKTMLFGPRLEKFRERKLFRIMSSI